MLTVLRTMFTEKSSRPFYAGTVASRSMAEGTGCSLYLDTFIKEESTLSHESYEVTERPSCRAEPLRRNHLTRCHEENLL